MKRITAIVRPEKLEPVKEALFAARVSGMTVSQVQGCGNQHGWKEFYRGTEVLLNMIPKVKFELVVDDGRWTAWWRSSPTRPAPARWETARYSSPRWRASCASARARRGRLPCSRLAVCSAQGALRCGSRSGRLRSRSALAGSVRVDLWTFAAEGMLESVVCVLFLLMIYNPI